MKETGPNGVYTGNKESMEMTTDRIIIIPDVHGRTFWRDAVKGRENDTIVFLGDYVDPYSFEGISQEKAIEELKAIIEFKKEHPQNVTLLLGNHDMGYLDERINTCRRDISNAEDIKLILRSNLALFDLVHVEKCEGVDVLFSHAGIREAWVNKNFWLWPDGGFSPLCLNDMLHNPKAFQTMVEPLSDASYIRGGYDEAGSVLWADITEFVAFGDFLPGYLHVFGHSLHNGGPTLIRGDKGEGWCTDCREALQMDRRGELNYLEDGSNG